MRTRLPWMALLLAAAWLPYAAAGADKPSREKIKPGEYKAATGTNHVPELWFPVGEELVYNIYWGIIPVGETRATTEWIEEDGRRLLLIRYRTKTNKVLSTLYPVDDIIESVVDPDGFRSLRFRKIVNEGSSHYDQLTVFDWKQRIAFWESKLDGKKAQIALEDDTRDIPTLMYWLRREPMPGTNFTVRALSDEKMYDVQMLVQGEDAIKVGDGRRVKSVKLEPKAADTFSGVFVRKGRMWLWVSRDNRRILTQLHAEVPVANVKLRLEEVNGPGDDEWVKKGDKKK